MNCCDAWGNCTRGPGCPAGSIVAGKLLNGVELPELEPYEFGPDRFVYPLHTENSDGSDRDAPTARLTLFRVWIGFLLFLAICDLCGMAALVFWR